MCGIAGAFDLRDKRPFPARQLLAMGAAIAHRGPDHHGSFQQPGVALHSRRLSIIDLAHGEQPISNEDGSVVVVFNGEIFNHLELRQQLEQRGHRFRTACDTEVLVHLWEERGVELLEQLEGQFALALYDSKSERLFLARDRYGICPLFLHRSADGWLLFSSEVKGLLASGMLRAELDPRGVDHPFTFFAMGTRRTMFAGVQALPPGYWLSVQDGELQERQYYDLDFPDAGQELRGPVEGLTEQLGELVERSVQLRLRSDVPVVSYLSGGVDSSLVAFLAARELQDRGQTLETFTIRIRDPKLDETDRALITAALIGTQPLTLECGEEEIGASYPDLVLASETAVIDTSSAALYRLAGEVRQAGYKVALTGEGADEALAGYPWHKASRALSLLDRMGLADRWRKRFLGRAGRGRLSWDFYREKYRRLGGYHAMGDLYTFCSMSGVRLYHPDFLTEIHAAGHDASADLEINLERMARWHPLNRSLYLGYKVMLAGLLMTHKGDRPAMANSVEARFPFLDRALVDFCARLDPELKLRGWLGDKFLLRQYARQHLHPRVALRPKNIFRAAYARSFLKPVPPYVEQLLSPESLARTGLFDPEQVKLARRYLERPHLRLGPHMLKEVGLVGVISTQLWHHLFLNSGLCELPSWNPQDQVAEVAEFST
jgi:asparagine synthase (glutamine-hydrolysing)